MALLFFSKTHAIPFLFRSAPKKVNSLSRLKDPLYGAMMMKSCYQRNQVSILGKFLSNQIIGVGDVALQFSLTTLSLIE